MPARWAIGAILTIASTTAAAAPQNVIVMIGDGMGFAQVEAAGHYGYGSAGTLPFESLPYWGQVTTRSADSSVTDSAAAATAIATGHKVNNGVISMAIPGDGSELTTMLELFSGRGMMTGLVTTTYMTHATPAAFGAHEPDRGYTSAIAGDYLTQTRPNILFGGGRNGMTGAAATAAGYTIVRNRTQMQALDPLVETHVTGLFGATHFPYEYDYATGSDDGYDRLPHLSEMAATALDILETDDDGFFLMVEGGRIDHAGHDNHIRRNIFETLEFADTVQLALDWAAGRDDTLVLVTSDHETGGLEVLQGYGAGQFPDVSWSTTGHTGVNVPIYAWGPNAEMVSGVLDNTDIFTIATIPEPATALGALLIGAILAARARRQLE